MSLSPIHALAALLPLLLAACNTTKPVEAVTDFDSRYDFSGVRKIAIQPVSRENPEAIVISDLQVDRINGALTDELRREGMTVVQDNSQADMYLVWHLVTEDKTEIRSYNSGTSYYTCWRCAPVASSNITVHQYTEGTFIVDMVDPVRNQSVWRSTFQSRLKSKPDPQESEERRREAAHAIFAGFPPG